MNTRIQLAGFYGMDNFGDDLFVAIARYYRLRLWPTSTVRTFAPAARWYQRQGPAGKLARLVCAALGAHWADEVVLMGGSVLQRLSGTMRLRARQGLITQALGVSVGPWADDRDQAEVTALLDACEQVVVRDAMSVHRYPRALLGGDLAALTPRSWLEAEPHGRVLICPSAAADPADVARFALRCAETLAETGAEAVVCSLNSHPQLGDAEVAQLVARVCIDRGVPVDVCDYRTLGLEATLKLIAGARAVWTQRLHGAVVAYVAGVPYVLAGHHEKCRAFAQDTLGLRGLVAADGEGIHRAGPASLEGVLAHRAVDTYRRRAEQAYLGAPLPQTSYAAVVPYFNDAEVIGDAVASILNQSVPPRAVLIVDDCSNADQRAKLDAWAARLKDPRVQVLTTATNGGPSVARNLGWDAARAAGVDWVAFCDADDRWLPSKMATQLDALAATGAGFVTGAHRDQHTRVRLHQVGRFALNNPVVTSAAVVPACCRTRFDPAMRHSEDLKAWLELAAEVGTFAEIGTRLHWSSKAAWFVGGLSADQRKMLAGEVKAYRDAAEARWLSAPSVAVALIVLAGRALRRTVKIRLARGRAA